MPTCEYCHKAPACEESKHLPSKLCKSCIRDLQWQYDRRKFDFSEDPDLTS